MKINTMKLHGSIYLLILFFALGCNRQELPEIDQNAERGRSTMAKKPSGTLFIIGGGKRPKSIITAMKDAIEMQGNYALIFPHAGLEPDSSFYYTAKDFAAHTDLELVNIKNAKLRNSLIDSVRSAPLIFITGGDQNRFLEEVHPAVRKAIKEAYFNGAVVGGTSAGAALMSKVMITGNQRDWPEYEGTYSRLHQGNGIYDEGLGLLDSILVDQHFVARSRYNRLISILADTGYPYGAGIDESTALVVRPDFYSVVGENQVVVMTRPDSVFKKNQRIGLRNMQLDIYLQGDTFLLNKNQ